MQKLDGIEVSFCGLKGYLQSKGELVRFKVDRTDSEMCEIFGVLLVQSEEDESDPDEG